MTNHERECLACLLTEYNTEAGILEFGTWQGLTTGYMARVLPNVPIYTIDIDDTFKDNTLPKEQQFEPLKREEVGSEYKGIPNTNITQIINDSLKCNLKNYIKHELDLVLVDANHSFNYVKNDCGKGLELLRNGGCLVLHDFDYSRLVNNTWNDPNLSCFGVISYITWSITAMNIEWNWIKDTCLIYCEKR
jgi:predicted O-methyltransferase YrrM